MATKQLLTYEDYLALPETMQRYEILDGELIMPPAPLFGHQWRSKKIFKPMDAYVEENQLGIVVYAPVDIMINKNPLRTRQPDILYISFEQLEGGKDSFLGCQKVMESPGETCPNAVSAGP